MKPNFQNVGKTIEGMLKPEEKEAVPVAPKQEVLGKIADGPSPNSWILLARGVGL